MKTKRTKTWNPHRLLVGAARKIWLYSPIRRETMKWRLCEKCGEGGKLAADHILPVGKQPRQWHEWGAYLHRLFEGPLQVLCEKCHLEKTNREREERRLAA